MNITGLEVLPGNARGATPPEKVELTYGQKLRVKTAFDYRGSAQKVTLYGSIGQRKAIIGFDEILSSENPDINLPESPSFTPCTASVDIPITADISPGTDYDLYAKISEYPDAGMPQVDDVITIIGIPPTFKLLEETIYPYAYAYDGPCDISTFTFKTDPFTPASWISGRLASHVEDEVKKAGGQVMEMRVYVDKSPLLWTDWRIEVVGTPPTTVGFGMPIAYAWWAIAILAALAIILIIVLTWSITTIIGTFTHKPISPEIKAAWSRETLIKIIGDFEAKLKLIPKTPDELGEMSDDELRDYCDKLAEMIVPPKAASIWPWIALGAAGIVATGLILQKRK